MSEFINEVITIEKVENIDDKYINFSGGGLKFRFFLNTKEGVNTKTYQQWLDMDLKKGDTVRVTYVIDEYKNQYGKTVKSKKAIAFQEAAPDQLPLTSHVPTASDISIIKQSMMKAAVQLAKTKEEAIEIADYFVEWVTNPQAIKEAEEIDKELNKGYENAVTGDEPYDEVPF